MPHKTITIIGVIALSQCSPCPDNPYTTELSCDAEPCSAIGDSGGDEAGEEALCSLYYEPEFAGQVMYCGSKASEGEHCTDSAANNYGITDFHFETQSATGALKFDFQDIPEVMDTQEPDATWFTWSGNWLNAVPGVGTHEQLGKVYAVYASRGCCAQHNVAGTLPNVIHNPACASGYTLNTSDLSYCLDMQDGSGAGLCVYPCTDVNDCPDPASMFCDDTFPDPADLAPGVCRFKAWPSIPTPLEQIGN